MEKSCRKCAPNFIFFSSPVPFNGQNYQKQKGSGTSHLLLFWSQSKIRKIPLLVIYYLTKFDDVIWSSFWVIPKVTSANLCKSIHDIIIPPPFVILNLEAQKGREKLQKFEYHKNEIKSSSVEIKSIFHRLKRAIIWWKNKNLIKDSGHKL